MRYLVTTFKNLKICIKELARFIRDGNHLETGRGFKKFDGLRSREVLALWLLCVVIEPDHKSNRFRICTDPQGGDGIIYDSKQKMAWTTEHILISRRNKESKDIDSAILKHIEKKQKKGGAAYASGKILIVFLNKKGSNWYPNRVARKLPKVDFISTWVVGLQGIIDGEYYYNVTRLDPRGCPIWRIHVKKTFDEWGVKRIQ